MADSWEIPRIWNGRCYALGGGRSLSEFDFNKLAGLNVVGCNDAYLLGAGIVPINCFGDASWFTHYHKQDTSKYDGVLVTNAPLTGEIPKYIKHCKRTDIHVKLTAEQNRLSWFSNTGVLAVELALKLGATEIILLGYDMKAPSVAENNWYTRRKADSSLKVYTRFMLKFKEFERQRQMLFPNAKIINANPDSALALYEKTKLESLL